MPRDAPTAATEIEPDRVLHTSLPSLLEAGNEICCATRSDAEEFTTRAVCSDPSTQSGGREGRLVVLSKSGAKVGGKIANPIGQISEKRAETRSDSRGYRTTNEAAHLP